MPPEPRTLVLCFDGTSNEYDGENTNVVKFFSLLKKDDSEQQLVYYQAGIGTFFNPGVVSPLFAWVAKILDEAVAWYIDVHVMDGYRYLMQNYRIGDKICLFGFSRGAYTARALAGMLYKVGLLVRDNKEQVAFAYKLYKRTDQAGILLSSGFKQTFSQDVVVDFVGVWDTVASVGVLAGRTLPFVDSNTAITTFRHALSLDEHRAKFRPNLYHRPRPDVAASRCDPECTRTPLGASTKLNGRQRRKRLFCYIKWKGGRESPASGEAAGPEMEAVSSVTDVLEVWFCGCHADIGGGSEPDNAERSLSRITLRWMVREVMASQCGILFDDEALARNSIPTTITFPPTLPELDDDKADAVQPIHDELKLNPLWWIVELFPLRYLWQDANGVWHTSYGWNLGRGRTICDTSPNFHVTVRERMNTTSLEYRPNAKWTKGSETYVR